MSFTCPHCGSEAKFRKIYGWSGESAHLKGWAFNCRKCSWQESGNYNFGHQLAVIFIGVFVIGLALLALVLSAKLKDKYSGYFILGGVVAAAFLANWIATCYLRSEAYYAFLARQNT